MPRHMWQSSSPSAPCCIPDPTAATLKFKCKHETRHQLSMSDGHTQGRPSFYRAKDLSRLSYKQFVICAADARSSRVCIAEHANRNILHFVPTCQPKRGEAWKNHQPQMQMGPNDHSCMPTQHIQALTSRMATTTARPASSKPNMLETWLSS